ncbi:MAG: hypothetical protein ACRDVE_18125 [Actinocrinis sp.]
MDFDQLNPQTLYGINPGRATASAHGGGGDTLPSTDAMTGDGAMIPWSPDSPIFWLVILGGATVLGIIGASFDVRAGKRHASVKVGD